MLIKLVKKVLYFCPLQKPLCGSSKPRYTGKSGFHDTIPTQRVIYSKKDEQISTAAKHITENVFGGL